MSQLAIETKGLKKSFGKQNVLNGVDLSVPSGSIYALLGPNGAGKTTLIHILSTLTAADAGEARIAGYDVATKKTEVKGSISLTGQFAAVDELLTGEENMRMICRLSGLSPTQSKTRTAELLERFELAAAGEKRVKSYSGGMRRRLDLAVSLVVERPVLFLDEPTTGLDTISRQTLWKIILQLKERGITVFLTTQYLEEADQLADAISVIDGGRIVATGTPAELKARVGEEVIELRDRNETLLQTVATSGTISDVRQALTELAPLLPPDTRVSLRKPSMDDVFLALTSQQRLEESVS
ncbi:ATP-binding cassette domain-containing protein [Cohnella cellulosilytica]|uniref:ATP-binding cassette domain-containing protein n=1 Tax=Cohnella cellulosilytica TaxID=986710 RepID=A0ABW2FBY6_9BACL